MSSSRSSRSKSARSAGLGRQAEILVAQWLQQQDWQILEQRWHCRWGELDLVAVRIDLPCLAFVEVKARSRGNWDANGLLAITPAKREKLALAAQAFLASHPDLANLPCRFDVALVIYGQNQSPSSTTPSFVKLGRPTALGGYSLLLQDYIAAAFE